MIYEPDLRNPYEMFTPQQLEAEITELTCEEEDCAYRGMLDRLDIIREHRAMATQALLNVAGVWS